MGKRVLMKSRIPAAVGAAALICVVLVSFTCIHDEEAAQVMKLLKARTDIMEEVLNGTITYEKGKSDLMTVESGTLLTDDLRNLRSYENTDHEPVINMEFSNIERTGSVYDVSCYECQVIWTYADTAGVHRENFTYRAGVRKQNGEFKLVMFMPDE